MNLAFLEIAIAVFGGLILALLALALGGLYLYLHDHPELTDYEQSVFSNDPVFYSRDLTDRIDDEHER